MKYKLECVMCRYMLYIEEKNFSNRDTICPYCGEPMIVPDELVERIDFNKIEELG